MWSSRAGRLSAARRAIRRPTSSTSAAGVSDGQAASGRRRFFAWVGLAGLALGAGGVYTLLRGGAGRLGSGRDVPLGPRGGRRASGPQPGRGGRPSAIKEYPDAERVALPAPGRGGEISTGEAIKTRRSHRAFKQRPLTQEELSDLLHHAGGITGPEMGAYGFRAAPSAGALYPIEIYPIIRSVEGVKPGIYHYHVLDHTLELVTEGERSTQLAEACLSQRWMERAAVVFVLTAIYGRTTEKYGERGYRYATLDCGHISENVYLTATAMGLGACAAGAFDDDRVNLLLGVDGEEESALLVLPIGPV